MFIVQVIDLDRNPEFTLVVEGRRVQHRVGGQNKDALADAVLDFIVTVVITAKTKAQAPQRVRLQPVAQPQIAVNPLILTKADTIQPISS